MLQISNQVLLRTYTTLAMADLENLGVAEEGHVYKRNRQELQRDHLFHADQLKSFQRKSSVGS